MIVVNTEVMSRRGDIFPSLSGGVGYSIPRAITGLINSVLHALNIKYSIDGEGGTYPKDVMLKLMNLKTGAVEVLAKLFGGQGTINVGSWSPDSSSFAFVSYPVD